MSIGSFNSAVDNALFVIGNGYYDISAGKE
jgi:hypothetical protein